jgi:hypothetical protein
VSALYREIVAAGPKFEFTSAEVIDLYGTLLDLQLRDMEAAAAKAASVGACVGGRGQRPGPGLTPSPPPLAGCGL